MTLLVIPIRKVTVMHSSYAFAWWPHPPYSTIHNYLTEESLPLMCHYGLSSVNWSCNQSVWKSWRVSDEGCEEKEERAWPCAGMWDFRDCLLCACSRHLFVLFLHVLVFSITVSQAPPSDYSYFWPAHSTFSFTHSCICSNTSNCILIWYL